MRNYIDIEKALKKLICIKCSNPQLQVTQAELYCPVCMIHYEAKDGIFNFLLDPKVKTELEKIEYDKVGGIDERAIASIGNQWLGIFNNAKLEFAGKSILEIGSGTGALTKNLANLTGAEYVFATDVSRLFLNKAIFRLADGVSNGKNLIPICCDCNQLPFAPNSLDLVVGRSILHHLVDYIEVLRQVYSILHEGSCAIFYEPILDGKLIIAFFSEMLLNIIDGERDHQFTDIELQSIKRTVRHITKEAWYPQDRDSLLKIEDKYIFTLAQMTQIGKEIGFKSVKILEETSKIDKSYWSYFLNSMRILNIDVNKIEKYRYISHAFEATYGQFSKSIIKPMGFFQFIK